jgi:hypothetical protein
VESNKSGKKTFGDRFFFLFFFLRNFRKYEGINVFFFLGGGWGESYRCNLLQFIV